MSLPIATQGLYCNRQAASLATLGLYCPRVAIVKVLLSGALIEIAGPVANLTAQIGVNGALIEVPGPGGTLEEC